MSRGHGIIHILSCEQNSVQIISAKKTQTNRLCFFVITYEIARRACTILLVLEK